MRSCNAYKQSRWLCRLRKLSGRWLAKDPAKVIKSLNSNLGFTLKLPCVLSPRSRISESHSRLIFALKLLSCHSVGCWRLLEAAQIAYSNVNEMNISVILNDEKSFLARLLFLMSCFNCHRLTFLMMITVFCDVEEGMLLNNWIKLLIV